MLDLILFRVMAFLIGFYSWRWWTAELEITQTTKFSMVVVEIGELLPFSEILVDLRKENDPE